MRVLAKLARAVTAHTEAFRWKRERVFAVQIGDVRLSKSIQEQSNWFCNAQLAWYTQDSYKTTNSNNQEELRSRSDTDECKLFDEGRRESLSYQYIFVD